MPTFLCLYFPLTHVVVVVVVVVGHIPVLVTGAGLEPPCLPLPAYQGHRSTPYQAALSPGAARDPPDSRGLLSALMRKMNGIL